MKQEFKRNDPLFSLCGLNCSLCPMFIRGDCTGCRAGSWCAQYCKIAPCSVKHGGVNYCFECSEYPCAKYEGIDQRDSLMSHRNQLTDMAKAKRIGIEAYRAEQREKVAILHQILDEYDDGFMDVFFCLAVNMMEVDDLNTVLEQAKEEARNLDKHGKADLMEKLLQEKADEKGVLLELRKWNGPWE